MPRGVPAAGAKSLPARKGHVPPALTAEYVESLKLYCDLLVKGGLTPKGVSRPEHLAVRIAVGRDLGISDTQAIANIMIVGGRPSVWGDLGWAMIRASGLLEDVETYYEGEPDTDGYTAVCKVKRVGAKREYVAKFSLGDARAANLLNKPGPWQEYRDRQLMWRAKGFASREEFPDVLCGLVFTEEAMDIPARVVETETVQSLEVKKLPAAATPAPSAVAEVVPPAVTVNSPAAEIDAVFSLTSAPGLPDGAATAETTATAPATPELEVKVGTGPITDEQVERLVSLRGAIAGAKKIDPDGDELDAAWKELLAGYDVTTAMDLTSEQARELIEDIIKAVSKWASEPAPKVKKPRGKVGDL
jgi:hypothetical protein